MALCGNVVPLVWLAHNAGYGIHPLKSELEQALENERKKSQDLQLKLDTLAEFFKGTGVKL